MKKLWNKPSIASRNIKRKEEETMEYNDGDIVWATWKNRWFLGEVHGKKRLPEGILDALRKPVIAFVKFFEEDTL